MPLRMARPMRRKESSLIQFRQRIPADVLTKARGLSLVVPIGGETASLTIGPKAQDVKVSLRTRDPSEAKERTGQVTNHLERVWRGLREGPRTLTLKEAVSLAGEVYRAFADAFEQDPGTPELWREVAAVDAAIEDGTHPSGGLLIAADDDERRAMLVEQRFGGFADTIIARHGLNIDEASRWRVLEHTVIAMRLFVGKAARNAVGDYSPDTNAARFPAFVPSEAPKASPIAAKTACKGDTLTGLVAAWWAEAKAAGRSSSTHESYRATMVNLVAFLGHDDPARVTPEDVVRFKDHRLASINPRTGRLISAKTVKDADLTGLKAVFGWAKSNRRMASNPASDITIKLGKQPRLRSKGFTDAEAKAVLSAAWNLTRGGERPKTFAAKHWVPWLCAYTGARLGEMVQLRKQDLTREGDWWLITITPEAGTVKSKETRRVVLHPHLVELGFPEFVGASEVGHLFLTPAPDGDVLGPMQGVKNRVGEFVRTIVSDPNVAPNHAWRHRFKTVGREVGIEERTLDVIQGHASRTVGEDYGDNTVKLLSAAMMRVPRYEV